jgi:hypothetical protein
VSDRSLRCPSSVCREGATLLGIVLPDGRVAYAPQQVTVTAEFVKLAQEGRSPEARFRFSGPCVKAACRQWSGTGCGVIEAVLAEVGSREEGVLPRCSIRPECRWFHQAGPRACAVCPEVVTDQRAGTPP